MSLEHLLTNNKRWAEKVKSEQPDFFDQLSKQQSPEYLWIGCSDSRVPANQIVNLLPGEIFVHRNVANQVVHSDLNCLSVMQFAVEVLKVKHIIVCGHYNCGGVGAVVHNKRVGLVDNWLRHMHDTKHKHQEFLNSIGDDERRISRLAEINVIEQVLNVGQSTVVQSAWANGQNLTVHGWIYGVHNGELIDLKASASDEDSLNSSYQSALEGIKAR